MKALSQPFVVAALLLVAEAAMAADGPPDARCNCRNRDGSRHELGQVVCLDVGGQRYLALCEMVLNVTSWQKVQDGCPSASLSLAMSSFQ